MSKAILVLDKMPRSCEECTLTEDCWCNVTGKNIKYNHAFDSCPLKLMPEKKEVCSLEDATDVEDWFDNGYNACIDELVGWEE